MRRVLATLAYWAVGLIVYPVRIGADWIERHGRPDEPIDPTWERHGGLMRARHEREEET